VIGGPKYEIDVNLNFSILKVKEIVLAKINRPQAVAKIIFGGKYLEDSMTVRDYDIKKDNVLQLKLT
jgi:hypothetical protein